MKPRRAPILLTRQLIGIALLIVCTLLAQPAAAHATLVFAHPADGMALSQPPAVLRLRFNEPVTALVIRLIDASGRLRGDLEVKSSGDTIEIVPPGNLGEGTQTLSYRIISADGHPVGGSLVFSIGASGPDATLQTTSLPLHFAIWLVRSIYYASMLFGVAGVFAFVMFGRDSLRVQARARLTAILACALVLAVASIGLQGADMLGGGLASLAQSASWRTGGASQLAPAVALALAASPLAIIALWRVDRRDAKFLSLLALVTMGLSFAAGGHASVAPPQWLMRPAVFAHIVCAALFVAPLPWLTGLLPASQPPRGHRALALAYIAGWIASGFILAFVQVETLAALVETPYGHILLAKLTLVITVFAIFVINARVLSRAAQRGSSAAGVWRIRLARAELLLVFAILMLTAGWRFTPPPRALLDAPHMLHIHTDKMMAMISFVPGRQGLNHARIDLMNPDFSNLTALQVIVTLTPVSRVVEALSHVASRAADGGWRIDNLHVPLAGNWIVGVEALITDFDKIEISWTFEFNR